MPLFSRNASGSYRRLPVVVAQSGQRRLGGDLAAWLLIDLVAIRLLTGLYLLAARAVA